MRINSSRRGHDMYVSIHTPTYVSEQVTNSRSDLRFFVLVPARCLASTNNKYNNCLLTVLKTNPGLSSLCKVHSVIISVYGRERGVIQPRPLEKLSGDRHPPPRHVLQLFSSSSHGTSGRRAARSLTRSLFCQRSLWPAAPSEGLMM